MTNVLSYSQERFWFLHRLDPGCAYYHECAPVRVRGLLNPRLLESSLAEVIRRHHVLRSRFEFREGRPTQHVSSRVEFVCPLIDLSHLPAGERDQVLRELALKGAQRPFDLEADLPMRATLLRCNEREHVLLLILHHIVSDTWSLGVILTEADALYRAWRQGAPSSLPELTLQYAEVAERERQRVEQLEKERAFWQAQLAGVPTSLGLPTDRPRPRIPSVRGAREEFGLSGPLSTRVRSLARHQGATLFMTLLTAFEVLLHRHSGATDVVVGSPLANRRHLKTDAMVGPFVNVLLLRSDLSGDPSFRELMARVKATCVAAYSHQDLPLQLVIRQTPELHGTQAHPFQVMFVVQNAKLPELRLGGLELRVMDLDKRSAVFDLDMQVWDGTSHLYGWLHYRTELFDATTIRRLLSSFETLLQGAVDDPDCPISRLPLLSSEQLHRQRFQWNDTRIESPESRCLHERIEEQARATPDAVAVVFEDEVVTYRELNRRANRLARHLRSLGVGPDVIVGVCMDRSVELVVALLGILKAGGAYLPLDPSYPAERLAFMVEDARPSCVLADRPRGDVRFEVTVVDDRALAGWDDADPCSGASAWNLAYVLYTSGSTGIPKGVAVAHRAIANRLTWMQRAHCLSVSDRVLQKSPFTFDVSVWELFWPLLAGATLVMARPGGHRDGGYLVDAIRRHQVTTLHFVPSMLAAFLQTRHVEACRTLRRVFCSGEALSAELAHEFSARLEVPLHNLYGPTEAAVDVTAWSCGSDDAVVPIGRPIDNTQVYVLDEHLQLVPVGLRGELYIGGVQLARGYLRRPDLTAERFVPDLLGDGPGERLYRTGDAVSYAADGNIVFIGRLDRQVKWNGVRVELGEIEAELERHPSVQRAIVEIRPGARQTLQLVAYVLQQAGPALHPGELKRFLRLRLPEVLLPTTIAVLDQFPLLPSGKVDRAALAQALGSLDDGGEGGAAKHVSPATELQRRILEVWRELFGTSQIGIDDNFFALGGHSMLAVQFVNKMYKEYGIDISVSLLFEVPTIAGLSEAVETALWAAGSQRSEASDGDEHSVEYEI
ncbi:amino acid adenylation domain-containing protein [Sorangium sp. So ce321]|uniref:non-ribosomal peptide synthetase n=1 Tax=Sorangium sp. So ce321 TaxID=3133300 RepID=UPI003F64079C